MVKRTAVYLIYQPSDALSASAYPFDAGHLAYKVERMHLLRGRLGANARGGMMVMSIPESMEGGNFASLASEITNECSQRGYHSVLLDLEDRPDNFSAEFSKTLCAEFARRKLRHYVPIEYAMFAPDAHYLVSSALSGGSLEERITALGANHGFNRIALAITRMRMDFLMPSPDGQGKELSAAELDAIAQNTGAQSFYSSELCLNYFTYMDPAGKSHFVLFDDVRSIIGKIQLAQKLSLAAVMIAYPETQDMLSQIASAIFKA